MKSPKAKLSIPKSTKKFQIALLVKDAKKMADNFAEFGVGPFVEEIYDGISATVRGKPAKFKLLSLSANMGPIEIELTQILEGGPIHREFLRKKGEGVHHLGLYVSDFDREVARWEKKGVRVIQWSRLPPPYPKEGGAAFMDTEKKLGIILEVMNPPPPGL